VIEATHSPANSPYGDIDRSGLFVGGELKWPLWRRDALGRVEQALTQQSRLQLESRFARDRIVNEVADAHSALTAAIGQLDNSRKNRELAAQMVDAERRAFELGRSDLLRVQLREIQLADARVAEVEAQLAGWVATVDLRAALGVDGAPTPVGP
jgi:cobalt-zinc-cadmium efflux system outer membrane protein